MHTIEPARLKPGADVTDVPDAAPAADTTAPASRLVRGCALIFCDRDESLANPDVEVR